jgi:hypothetical protein
MWFEATGDGSRIESSLTFKSDAVARERRRADEIAIGARFRGARRQTE